METDHASSEPVCTYWQISLLSPLLVHAILGAKPAPFLSVIGILGSLGSSFRDASFLLGKR